MFLFSKSIIAVANSVKISRRIFLDRSQGLKCTKKLKNSLDPEAYFFLKTKKSKMQLFSHLTNSKFRAGLSGVSSATPSSWKPQFLFQKRDLLQKTENLHATLDWEVYLRIINFFHIWQIQNLEQVYPVSVLLLPAPESLNSFFKNAIYCKKLKICMRPWIRKL